MNIIVRPLKSEAEVLAAYKLEVDGYPEDEAALLESMIARYSAAPELFLGAWQHHNDRVEEEEELLAFVCGTRSKDISLTHTSMSEHIPLGESLCIHSVCTSKDARRRGLALQLLHEYVRRVRYVSTSSDVALRGVKRLLLIAHEELLVLYKKAGFEHIGESNVSHGSRKWHECIMEL